MRVLITGAGVAGLSCAVAMRRAGDVDVTVVERSSEVAAHGGTGIAIPPNGARALRQVGLPVDDLVTGGSRLRSYRFLDTAGRALTSADLTRLWLSEGEPYFAVHRRSIYDALLEAMGDQAIEFGTTAEAAAEDLERDEPLEVVISGPGGARRERFDLVVGADGIRSRLRQALWPDLPPPRSLGWSTWRCVVDHEPSESDAQVVYSGLGGVFLYIPLGPERVYVYAAHRQVEAAPAAASGGHGRALVDRFGGFGAPRSLFDSLGALPDDAFHVGPLEEVPHERLGAAGRGRALLVGDALHACSPNMAQGVSLAAEDACVLADLVSRGGTEGLAERFWNRRLPRIRHVQELTRKRDHLVNKRAASALFQRVSNLVMRMKGGDRLQREAFSYLLDNRA